MSINVMSAKTLVFLGATALGCVALSSVSFAQTSAEIACFAGPAKMSDADVQAFLAQPASLLSDFASGGRPMSTRVRSLAGSDASTVDPILAQIPAANPAQVAAIGAGLARAAKACVTANAEYSATISEKVALLRNLALETAFAGSSVEVQTAAINAVGTGGGTVAGIAGGGAAGGGANGAAGGTSTSGNSSGSFSTGSGGSVSTTTTTNSVSPSTL